MAKKADEKTATPAEPSKHPGGRPTDYRPEYCERVIEFGLDGKLPAQMASKLGVCKDTLHEWARVHAEFSDAFTLARGHAEAWHLEKATETATGQRGGNAPMAKFLLSAAFGYREASDVGLSSPDGGAIKTDSVMRVEFVKPSPLPDEDRTT